MQKILIVDDDTFLLDMYAIKFGEAGYEVTTATSVEAALTLLREGKLFEVVLLDMIMPQQTGLDLLRIINEEKLSHDPVRIVLSNQGEHADIEAAEALGSHGYIVKANMIPSEVVAKVKEIVSKVHA